MVIFNSYVKLPEGNPPSALPSQFSSHGSMAFGLQDSHGTEEVVSVIQLLQAWERKHSTLNLKAQILCELMSWFLCELFLLADIFWLVWILLLFFLSVLCFFLSADFRRLRRLRWWSLASHTVWSKRLMSSWLVWSKGLALQPKGIQCTGDIWYQIYAYTKRFIGFWIVLIYWKHGSWFYRIHINIKYTYFPI